MNKKQNRQSGGTIGVTVALLVIICGVMMVSSIYIYTSIRISSNKISRTSNELLIKNYSYNYLANYYGGVSILDDGNEYEVTDPEYLGSDTYKIIITENDGNNKVVIEYEVIKDIHEAIIGYEILSYKFN